MIHFQAPILMKVRDGIRVNLSMTVSHAIERQLPQRRLVKEVAEQVKARTLNRELREADYEQYDVCDTVSFWFAGGSSLSYRVGHEVTQEDFERIVRDLQSLEYRSDRKPSDSKAGAPAK